MDDLGGAACVEAVDEGDADPDFGRLAVGVSSGDAFTESFQAPHPLPGNGLFANHERVDLDPAAGVISRPALPERSAVVPCGAQGFVSCGRGGAVLSTVARSCGSV